MNSVYHAGNDTLRRIQKEYSILSSSSAVFSMADLLDSKEFRLQDYCKGFEPHPDCESLRHWARKYSEGVGIWLPQGEHYITCCLFLFPNARIPRMKIILKNCAIDFYLNDVWGREVFHHLSRSAQKNARTIINRMGGLSQNFIAAESHSPIEAVNFEMLQEIAGTSPGYWFREFLELYCYHIELAHCDCNTKEENSQTVAEYIHDRCHIAGMPHTIALIEYSSGGFLDWSWLESIGMKKKLRGLNWVTAQIGCLLNDLFSFEKEVIDNSCDSNLICRIASEENILLFEAIRRAAALIRDLLISFGNLMGDFRRVMQAAPVEDFNVKNNLLQYLAGLQRCVQASWEWQVFTERYKRPNSIWRETQLQTSVSARAV